MPIHRAQLHLQLQGVARRSLLVVAVQVGVSGGVEVLFVQCVEGGVLAAVQEASTSMPLLKLEGNNKI